jgi:hypothetical protein
LRNLLSQKAEVFSRPAFVLLPFSVGGAVINTRTEFVRLRASWLLALALLAVAGGTGKVRAQVLAKAAPAQAWPDEQFENWVFNNEGNAASARKRFEAKLKLRIEEIDRNCQITEGQKQKLQLMGCGDIKQIFDAFEKAKHQFNLLDNDVQKLQDIIPFIQPIQAAQHNLFHDGSLLAKSLRHTLTKEQFERYEVVDRERREFRHKAQIELAVHTLEESIPLRAAERRELLALLNKEIAPARKSSQYGFYVLMARIANLPDQKIKPLFTDTQWKLWEKQANVYKNLMANWRKAGIVLDDEELADLPAEKGK